MLTREVRKISREWAPWDVVRVGERPIPDVVRELNHRNPFTPWMADFLGELLKTPAGEPCAVKIARVALFELDFSEQERKATFGQIVARGADYGLGKLSLEAALLARLKYTMQPEGEFLLSATPAKDKEEAPCAFSISNEKFFGMIVAPLYVMPERRFAPDTEVLFRIP